MDQQQTASATVDGPERGRMIVVTGAIIEHGGKVLLTQRLPGKNQGLKWEFPGGKIDFGETPEACLVREIREELNMDIEVVHLFDAVSHVYGDLHVILLLYRCKWLSGTPLLVECSDYRFVEPLDLLDYDLAEADISVAKKLMQMGGK